jgi:3-oxoacyl-(acyl-carrier-protein) synthase
VFNRPRHAKIRIALNNSFGFGGTNSTLAFKPAVELGGK